MQAPGPLNLPSADPVSAEHSVRCREFIATRIHDAGGAISFAEFMQHALYAPELGYYVSGSAKLGPGGDFVTAPEVSPLFGAVVARQLAPLLETADAPDILEVGAGSGQLAVDVLTKLKAHDCLPERYRILDVSPDLEARQRARLADALPGLPTRVEWLSEWPAGHHGVVIANEVLDALPVERFARRRDQIMQKCVSVDRDRFIMTERPAPDWMVQDIREIEEALGRPFEDDFVSEYCPAASAWIAELAGHIDAGLLLLFDYGLSRHEYYAADRSGGWLRCHFRHHAHNDPLILPGIQDITAWVDFTRIAEAAFGAGFDVAGYLPQAQFLLHGGLAEEISGGEISPALSREIKLLTLPGEMGEHFKCMALTKGAFEAPSAFSQGDQRHRL